jgi:C4-type Zn-finger protein
MPQPKSDNPEFSPMTADQVKELVTWLNGEIETDSKISAVIQDPLSKGRITGMKDVIRQLIKMGVIKDAS